MIEKQITARLTEEQERAKAAQKRLSLIMPIDSSGGVGGVGTDSDSLVPPPKIPNTARNNTKTKMDFDQANIPKSPEAMLTSFSFTEQKNIDYMMNRDPMQEFFTLTCQSIKLNSPHMNTICTIDTN